MAMENEISGIVTKIVFSSEDGAFSVFRIEMDSSHEIVTVAGRVAAPYVGESVVIRGCWKKHPRFGMQWSASEVTMVKPKKSEEILRLLESGMVKGIGPAMAKRIVGELGDKTLEIMDSNIEALLSIPGIGKQTLKKIKESYHGMNVLQELVMYLGSLGISSKYAGEIQKLYGSEALNLIKAKPYQLIKSIPGFGFLNADRIALTEGISPENKERVLQGFFYVLSQGAGEGHACLPLEDVIHGAVSLLHVDFETLQDLGNDLIAEGYLPSANYDGRAFAYLPSLYDAEAESAAMVDELLSLPDLGSSQLAVKNFEKENQIVLDDDQKKAVENSLHSGLLIITGGPGTGKTTIIKAIIEVAGQHNLSLSLMAPTGRAAKRLAYLSGRDAYTIHKTLEAEKHDDGTVFLRDENNPLEADLVIVDEASMIDISLFHHLLCALKPGARLILVGDADQLPPVGPGFPLRDLMASKEVPVIHLTHIFRQKKGSSIIENASLIREGKMCRSNPQNGFLVYPVSSDEEAFQTVVKICRSLHYDDDKVKFNMQILSPLYKGVCGVDHLNDEIQKLFHPGIRKDRFQVGDKVMQRVNDYEKEVYNGDIGIVWAVTPSKILVHYPDREVTYEGDERNGLQLAYTVTVHKCQGSEYHTIIFILLDSQYRMLQRNLLYTGITRAREQVILITSGQALERAIQNKNDRNRWSLFLPMLLKEVS
jgi:exodeoxyribonuclease V alpha subunit